MAELLVSDTLPMFILLFLVNLISFFTPLPVFVQLVLSAAASIHLGCILSARIQTASYVQIKNCENQGSRDEQTGWDRIWQIIKYPITATVLLVILYLAITWTEEMTLNLFLDSIFILATTFYAAKWAKPDIERHSIQFCRIWRLSARAQKSFLIFTTYMINAAFWFAITSFYISNKHWLLNNAFALVFAVFGVKQGNLRSFKLAFPMLWLLFFYDLYWVYQSDVMVTVAKGIELPLKLKFPFILQDLTMKFSMLGLGDIIIPGMLLSLCLKYDVDSCIHSSNRPKKVQDFKLTLYHIGLSAYIISIILTYSAMYFFNHPQPALVFIVPLCSISILIGSYFLKRKYSIFVYTTNMLSLRKGGGTIM